MDCKAQVQRKLCEMNEQELFEIQRLAKLEEFSEEFGKW